MLRETRRHTSRPVRVSPIRSGFVLQTDSGISHCVLVHVVPLAGHALAPVDDLAGGHRWSEPLTDHSKPCSESHPPYLATPWSLVGVRSFRILCKAGVRGG